MIPPSRTLTLDSNVMIAAIDACVDYLKNRTDEKSTMGQEIFRSRPKAISSKRRGNFSMSLGKS